MKKLILLIFTAFFCLHFTYAQPGTLDSSFGNNGIVIDNLAQTAINSSSGRQVLLQEDGSIYIILELYGSTVITKRKSSGAIDESYGTRGFSAIQYAYPVQAAMQPNGKIVVVASTNAENSNFFAFRYNVDGSIDKAFITSVADFNSTNVYASDYASCIAIQKDGKIVVGGVSNSSSVFAIARFNANGGLDSSFSEDGLQATNFNSNQHSLNAIAIQDDGKIVAAGTVSGYTNNNVHNDIAIARYNGNGTLDKTFSSDGKQIYQAVDSNGKRIEYGVSAIAIQKDGKIVTAGNFINRFNADGTEDNTFLENKKKQKIFPNLKPFTFAFSMVIQADGAIVVGGSGNTGKNQDYAIARYKVDGSLDLSLSGDGVQTTDFDSKNDYASSIAIQADGKILIAGTDGDCEGSNCGNKFAVARYNTDGTLDNAFGKNGKLTSGYPRGTTSFSCVITQKDGKSLVTGSSNDRNFILRYDEQGKLDNTFGNNGIKYTDHPISSIAIQPDQKIVVAGDSFLTRYNSDAQIDTAFGTNGSQKININTLYNFISTVIIQKDGKILLAGNGIAIDSNHSDYAYIFLARYNARGSPDITFGNGGIQLTESYDPDIRIASAATDNKKIVVAGTVSNFRHSGIVVATFAINGGSPNIRTFGYNNDNSGSCVAIQNDGKIVVGGTLFLRFKNDLSLDSSFSGDRIDPTSVSSIAIQEDGKILLGGINGVARYNTNGYLDSTFNKNGIKVIKLDDNGRPEPIYSIAIQKNSLYAVGTIGTTAGYNSLGSVGLIAKLRTNGTAPPVVNITTPVNDTIYTAPARIKINVAAIPVNSTITKVEFYNGTALLHTERVIPYGYQWKNVPAGDYTITAKATDSNGVSTTSSAIHVSVVQTQAPTVNITNPKNNKTIPGPLTLHLKAAANDPDGKITKVQFFNRSGLLKTVDEFPYTYAWRNVQVGKHSVYARATDNMGVVTTSEVISFTVVPSQRPIVSIIKPLNNQSFEAPGDIHLEANASDPDGRITRVEFYNGYTLLGREYEVPYTYHWQNVPAGTYTITARAVDNYALTTVSEPIIITVKPINTIVSERAAPINITANAVATATFKVLPNPATDMVTIYTAGLPQNKQLSLSVLAASGSVMQTTHTNSSNKLISVNTSGLTSGVYTIRLISGDKVIYKQFVKL